MNFINEFFNEYGMTIVYTAVTGIFGYVGLAVKKLCTKYINDKEKKEVAELCVKFVEQVYKELHGEEKFEKAVNSASSMLQEKGIKCCDEELKILIEAAVNSFNKQLTA